MKTSEMTLVKIHNALRESGWVYHDDNHPLPALRNHWFPPKEQGYPPLVRFDDSLTAYEFHLLKTRLDELEESLKD